MLWLEAGLRMQSWRVYEPPQAPGWRGRFAGLVALTLAAEVIVALYVMGAFYPYA